MKHFVSILLFLPLLAFTAPAPSLPSCTQAQHDAYTSLGPDGARYPTWHPQIDLKAGCVFDHEHGSDPALYDPAYQPLYGYAAQGMPEGHAGFKGYAFTVAGVRVYITQHMGTSSPHIAACARYHTLDTAMADASGTIADVHMMAEYGASRENTTNTPLAAPGCPEQQTAYPTCCFGLRLLPIMTQPIGYEPWRANATGNRIGFNWATLTINTKNPRAYCDTITCTTSIQTADVGTWRELSAAAGYGFSATGVYSGTFFTDAHATGPGTIRQFIRPGANVHLPGLRCYPFNPLAYIYRCDAAAWDEAPFRRNVFVTGAN